MTKFISFVVYSYNWFSTTLSKLSN